MSKLLGEKIISMSESVSLCPGIPSKGLDFHESDPSRLGTLLSSLYPTKDRLDIHESDPSRIGTSLGSL